MPTIYYIYSFIGALFLSSLNSWYWYKQGYRIDLRKVKGHAGNEWNELADQLATGYISEEEAYATYS